MTRNIELGDIILDEMLNLVVDGKKVQYKKGTVLKDIAKDFQKNYDNDIIMSFVEYKLSELIKTVNKDCEIKFLTGKSNIGYSAYRRSLILIMLKAVDDITDQDKNIKVNVLYSIGNAYYCEINQKDEISVNMVNSIKERMRQIINEDIPITKRVLDTSEAIEIFRKRDMQDKVDLFKYRVASKVNLYGIDGYEDYYYGYMAPSTGYMKYFELIKFDDGMILQYPIIKNPKKIVEFEPPIKLFNIFKNNATMRRTMNVNTIGELNNKICDGTIDDLILVQEAFQEKRISEIARSISEKGNKKFIMIAGPSSSGKTTFSHRLSTQLFTCGLVPHPIAVDNYFVNRDKTPLDENGEYNYECLEAIDIEKFNEDMTDLLNGKKVELPEYNFKKGIREYHGNFKQLGKNDILVIEGIHGLNDKLSLSLPSESKFKIYISALTQLNVDDHTRIRTTDGRLLRRIVRDSRTRGVNAKQTIARWNSVRKGENQYIFPFQEEADEMFNSALIYELSVLKTYVMPQLFAIERWEPEYVEAKRLLKFLSYVVPLPSENIAKNSILREFIGGSCFNV